MKAHPHPSDMSAELGHPAPMRPSVAVRGPLTPVSAVAAAVRGAGATRAAIASFAAVAVLALCAAAARAAVPVAAHETWYRISIDGRDAGWQRTSEEPDPAGVRSTSESFLRVGRDGAVTEVRIRWTMLESAKGTPIECVVEQSVGAAPTRTRAEFGRDGTSVSTTAEGRTMAQRMPALPEGCLGPAAAARHIESQRSAGSTRIACTTIDPASGLGPIDIVTVPSAGDSCWRTTTSAMPVDTLECLDDKGDVVRAESRMGIGTFVVVRTDRARALAPLPEGGAGLDVLRISAVPVRPSADGLLRAQRASVRVRAREGTLALWPSSGAQRVEAIDGGASMRVDVDCARSSEATDDERSDRRYRDASPLVDAADPAVMEATKGALAKVSGDDAARAEALRSFVHRHITGKDMASVFASASAVVRNRSGDCSEHAVLLAAMLRAAGTPSRLAAGLVYARDFAGMRSCYAWHMWTQALIGGQWRDLDATLADRPFHAGHILVATGAQDGPSIDPVFAGMVMAIGNLDISVESVDGTPVGGT
jgi:hypothetical protein